MITVFILSNMFNTHMIENILIVLDLFNAANEKRDMKHKIDFKEFYNEAINNEVVLRDHISLWVLEREDSQKKKVPMSKFNRFTLCHYPWVLNPSNKSTILKIFSKHVQSVTQDRDILNSFSTFNAQNPLSILNAMPYLLFKVRRDHLLEDALTMISSSQVNLKKPLKVSF